MSISLEAVAVLMILLPGFVSSAVLDHVVVRKSREGLAQITEALVFSFLIYATLVSVGGFPVVRGTVDARHLPNLLESAVNRRFVLGALLLSLLLPLVLGFLNTTDLHMKIARRLRISNKTARETTWLDVFSEQRRYVIVNLSGQRRIFGWPQYYSNDREEGLLYLFDPAWVNDDGTYTNLDIHGMFLVEAGSIESIEFTNVTSRTAYGQADRSLDDGEP